MLFPLFEIKSHQPCIEDTLGRKWGGWGQGPPSGPPAGQGRRAAGRILFTANYDLSDLRGGAL